MKHVIIGNSAAAVGAVEGIRQVDKENPITIIAAEPHHTYSRPLISYYLAGKVAEEKMYYRPLDFYEKNGVELLEGISATGIDVEGKKVVLENGMVVLYDRLLVAAGGKPFIPPLEGLEKKNVFTFHKLNDVKDIQKVAKPGMKVVILGAGLIGTKAAEALILLGLDVTVAELSNRLLGSILDEQAASLVQTVMEEKGVKFIFGKTITRVLGETEVKGVQLSGGEILDCDLFIVAIGVVPNTQVVQGTPIAVNRGILINEEMETSEAGIYGAGDIAEGMDAVLGSRRVIPILPNAYKQGETAGLNMAGAKISYKQGFAMNAIGFFGYPLLTAGLVQGDGEGFEELSYSDEVNRGYRKVVLKDNKLKGYIALQAIDRLGMLTSMIEEEIDVSPFKDKLVKPGLGYADWPQEMRKERMLSGGGRK